MPGLYTFLSFGSGAVLAQQSGLGSAGHNLANLNTPGFSRTRVDLRSHLGPPLQGGVSAGPMSRYEDGLLSGRERRAAGESGRSRDLLEALSALEGRMASGSGGVPEALNDFFAGLRELEAHPGDPGYRTQLARRAEALAQSIRRTDEALRSSIEESNLRIEGYARRATELAHAFASVNAKIAQNPDPTYLDQRDQIARELSGLVGGQTLGTDGQARFVLADGSVLVDGHRAAAVEAQRRPGPPSIAQLEIVDGAHRSALQTSEGQVAGQTQAQQHMLGMLGDVDTLAFDFANAFNAVHRGFAALDGSSGRDFFQSTATATGAAAGFRVDSAIAADARLIGGAQVGSGPGDNQGFRALGDLASQPLAGGGTRSFLDEAISVGESLGYAVVGADHASTVAQETDQVLAGLRDALSGVSSEEEMARLMAFQRASEASIRFVQTVDSLLGTLLERR